MPYQYNYNKRCNCFRKNQERGNAIREYYIYDCASKNGLNIKSY